jgi:cell wall-associated NlpC family hydrolase
MVPVDEKLEIIEGQEGDQWVKIVIDEDEGYVNTDYVKISQELDKAMTMSELRYGSGVSDVRVSLVNYAMQFIGNPYVWGGTSLTKGADCSGFVQQIFAHFGATTGRTSRDQYANCLYLLGSEVMPGDLVFYADGNYINHVAIYAGNNLIIHAANSRTGIKVSRYDYRRPYAYGRFLFT